MRLTPNLLDTVQAALDGRLSRAQDRPLAVCVSGGGDSIALLHLTAIWAKTRGRRLIVLSVDHGLNPTAHAWNLAVRTAAEGLGAEWRGLRWSDDKPQAGLQVAARIARHALLADAARSAGARVLLMGHTADDIAEGDWMRHQGAPLGRLREWAPSPAWPEGRGLMLLRPLLSVRRAALRAWLTDQAVPWIEDPANSDDRFLRSRARAMRPAPSSSRPETRLAPADFDVDPASGAVRIEKNSSWLGHALACAAGRAEAVTQSRLAQLRARLETGAPTASLGGAMVQVDGDRLILMRESGRRPPGVLALACGVETVWDGRFLFRANSAGWRVGPAAGHRSALPPLDRRILNRQPARARAVHPVLFRDGDLSPFLASEAVEASCLVAERLYLATGGVQTEDDLAVAIAS